MVSTAHQISSIPLARTTHGEGSHRRSQTPTLLRKLLRAEKHDLWITVMYSIVIGLISLAVPIATQAVVNTVAFGTVLQPLVILTVIVFLALGFSAILQILRTWIVEALQQRLFVRISGHITSKLLKSSVQTLTAYGGPELVNRFLEVATLQKATSILLVDGLAITSQIIFSAVLLAIYHPWLLGFDLVLMVLISFFLFAFMRSGVATSIAESHTKYELVAWFEELARHPLLFRSSLSADYAATRTDGLLRLYLKNRRAHFSVLLKQITGFLGIHALSSAALLGIGGWLVIQRQLTLGQLIAAELVVNLMLVSLSKFGKQLETYYDLQAAMDKLRYLTDLPAEPEGCQVLPSGDTGMAIALRNATVRREDGGDLFRGVNLTIAPGECIGLQGPAGSGKSTLLDCICGLRPLHEGAVELDRQDIRYLQLQSLRSQIALIREAAIFEGTVEENLTFGDGRISQTELQQTLVDLGVWDFIRKLPQGLQTHLHAGDPALSPSQAMRLTMARALLSRPRLLVLDIRADHLVLNHQMLRVIFTKNPLWTLIVCGPTPELQEHCHRVLTLLNGSLKQEAAHDHQ
jgi:putative ABC transport system ATP-binding protein